MFIPVRRIPGVHTVTCVHGSLHLITPQFSTTVSNSSVSQSPIQQSQKWLEKSLLYLNPCWRKTESVFSRVCDFLKVLNIFSSIDYCHEMYSIHTEQETFIDCYHDVGRKNMRWEEKGYTTESFSTFNTKSLYWVYMPGRTLIYLVESDSIPGILHEKYALSQNPFWLTDDIQSNKACWSRGACICG